MKFNKIFFIAVFVIANLLLLTNSLSKFKKVQKGEIISLDSADTPNTIGAGFSKASKVSLGEVSEIFVSAQLGVDPKTNKLVSDSVGEQTTQALKNGKAIIE
jgi:enamine deaminase RidA (YjgF/YER057c/UK114 family)